MSLNENLKKIRFHLKQIKNNYNLKSIIGKIFSILYRRSFVPGLFKKGLFYLGYEYPIRPFFQLKKDEIFIDVGAHVGLYSYIMSKKCKKVIAFEPNPITFRKLKRVVRDLGNVEVKNLALANKKGKMLLFLHHYHSSDSIVLKKEDFTGETIEVNVRSLDSFNFEKKIGLIKIDTEGAEIQIVEGGLKTIEKHRPRLIIELHPPFVENFERIKQLLPFYEWKRFDHDSVEGKFYVIGDA